MLTFVRGCRPIAASLRGLCIAALGQRWPHTGRIDLGMPRDNRSSDGVANALRALGALLRVDLRDVAFANAVVACNATQAAKAEVHLPLLWRESHQSAILTERAYGGLGFYPFYSLCQAFCAVHQLANG